MPYKELDQLFFQEESMQLVPRDLIARISEETSKSCYLSFQKMLKEDRIDLFFLGDFNEIEVLENLKKFNLTGRKETVNIQYQQGYSNVLREGIARKKLGQSILEMGYHSTIGYGDDQRIGLASCEWFAWSFPAL